VKKSRSIVCLAVICLALTVVTTACERQADGSRAAVATQSAR
jgi:hypothetical protein